MKATITLSELTDTTGRIKLNGEILHTWEDGQPVYASSYQAPVNKGVDGIRPETYLVESEHGQKQRVSVRFVEFNKK